MGSWGSELLLMKSHLGELPHQAGLLHQQDISLYGVKPLTLVLFVIAASVTLPEVHKHLEESPVLGWDLDSCWSVWKNLGFHGFFSTASSFSPLLSIIKRCFLEFLIYSFLSTSERKAGQNSQCVFYNVGKWISLGVGGLPKTTASQRHLRPNIS